MKKTYKYPTSETSDLATQQPLAASTLSIGVDSTGDVNTTDRTKGAVWEDGFIDEEEIY